MRAVEISQPGGPEVLKLVDAAACRRRSRTRSWSKSPPPGVNRPDVLQRMGIYPVPPGASDLPGLEIAGEVVAIGSARERSGSVGDKVCALVARRRLCRVLRRAGGAGAAGARRAVDDRGRALPETFFTVWGNVFDRGRLAPGEIAPRPGRHRGIGVTAIQMAKASGNRVFATAGLGRKVRRLRAPRRRRRRSTTRRRISSPR